MATTIDLQHPMTPTAIVVALDAVTDATQVTTVSGTTLRLLKATYEQDCVSTSLGQMTWTQITGFTRHQLQHAVRVVRIEGMPTLQPPAFDHADRETLASARQLITRHALSADVGHLLISDDHAARIAALHLTGQRLIPRRGDTFSKTDWAHHVRSSFEQPHWLPGMVEQAQRLQDQIIQAFMISGISTPGAESLPLDALYKTIRTMSYPFMGDAGETRYGDLVTHEQRAHAACFSRLKSFEALASADFLALPVDSFHATFVRDHAQLVKHVLYHAHNLKLNTYRSGTDPIWADVIYGSMRPSEALSWSRRIQSLKARENDDRARRAASLILKAADAIADHVRPHIATIRAGLRDLPEIKIQRDKTSSGSRWVIEIEGFRLAAPLESEASPWACQSLVAFITTLADHLITRNPRQITYLDFLATTWKADAI